MLSERSTIWASSPMSFRIVPTDLSDYGIQQHCIIWEFQRSVLFISKRKKFMHAIIGRIFIEYQLPANFSFMITFPLKNINCSLINSSNCSSYFIKSMFHCGRSLCFEILLPWPSLSDSLSVLDLSEGVNPPLVPLNPPSFHWPPLV